MTGNFYCVPSNCARVVYREYLPPVVRWRYSGEDWNEIKADNYTVNQPSGQCDTGYLLRGTFEGAYKISVYCRGNLEWYSNPRLPVPGAIIGFEERIISGLKKWVILYQRPGGSIQAYTNLIDIFYRTEFYNRTNCNSGGAWGWEGGFFSIDSIERADGQPDNCGDCVFTVYLDNQIVHQETRSECPEVEQLPCRLSDEIKQIQIQKLPFLERVEIVNESRDIIYLPPAGFPIIGDTVLPTECLHIYKTYITAPTGINDFVPLPGIYNPYEFIKEICSAPGCPPPEYQVICDCDNSCESCPDGTCAVLCDGHVCCYGDDGIAVKSIPLADYCGD